MKDSCATAGRLGGLHLQGIASMALILIGFGLAGIAGQARGAELSTDDMACLSCHDKEGLSKTLTNGEVLSLDISTQGYLASMHKDTGCEDCHDDLDAKTHGKQKTLIKSKREFSMTMREACRGCHKKKFIEYDDSVHAALVKQGSTRAPVCSDCHNPHTVRSAKIVQPFSATPCARCHEDIFLAFSADVHGTQTTASARSAPVCSSCHQAHGVMAASLGEGVKNACLSCHKNMLAAHEVWLPNTARHFETITCPVCHAPNAQRRVNLRLYDGLQKRQVLEKSGVPQFEKRTDAADSQHIGLDERALWSLLNEFNQDGVDGSLVLRGRLEVSSGVQAHQLSDKSAAIKECDVCHKKGAAAFQSVTLTVAGPDGRPLRHGIQKDVLSSLTAMNSVRGFYAIGATRIKLLDNLLVLVLLGAVSVPVGHMTIKRIFKLQREKLEAQRRAEAGEDEGSAALAERRTNSDPET